MTHFNKIVFIVIDVDQLQQYSKFPLPVAKEAILLQVLIM